MGELLGGVGGKEYVAPLSNYWGGGGGGGAPLSTPMVVPEISTVTPPIFLRSYALL